MQANAPPQPTNRVYFMNMRRRSQQLTLAHRPFFWNQFSLYRTIASVMQFLPLVSMVEIIAYGFAATNP